MAECKVYIGGLPHDATSQEIEDAFHRYGRIRKVWVARRPPGFAFVEFEDGRDAEDAVRSMDGARICGVRARVELSHGKGRGGGSGGGGGGGGGRGGDRGGGYDRRGGGSDRGGGRGRSRSRSPRRSRSPHSRSRSRSPPARKASPAPRSRSPSRSRSRS